jgi:hypothetical protein
LLLSTSVAVTVVTAVLFSLTLMLAEAPPPLLVITGASLTAVTPTVRVAVLLAALLLSVTVKLTVRAVVLGFSLLLL